jgi:hypothetical protein
MEAYIKMGLVETGLRVVDCVYLALNRDMLLVHMSSIMKFREMRQLPDGQLLKKSCAPLSLLNENTRVCTQPTFKIAGNIQSLSGGCLRPTHHHKRF